MTVGAFYRRDFLAPGEDTTVPLVGASMADRVADFMGLCTTGSNVDATVATNVHTLTGIRHARLGRVTVGAGTQRSIARALGAMGVGLLANPDDLGTQTPATRMNEMLNEWGGATIDAFGGPNEPQRTIGLPANWPLTDPATDGGDSTSSLLSVGEIRRVAMLMKTSRDATGRTDIPVLSASLSLKGVLRGANPGWYDRMAAAGPLDPHIDGIEMHNYSGGQPLEKNGQQAAFIAEMDQVSATKPVWITECGWHDFMATTGTHIPTPRDVSATYMGRSIFELMDLPRVVRAYLYEAVDDPGADIAADHEPHFGLSEIIGTTLTLKPHGATLARTLALYNDPGAVFLPASARIRVNTVATDLQARLHAKRDGTHLLALWQKKSIYNQGAGTYITVPDVSVSVSVPDLRAINAHRTTPGTVTPLTRSGGGTVTTPVGADLTVLHIAP